MSDVDIWAKFKYEHVDFPGSENDTPIYTKNDPDLVLGAERYNPIRFRREYQVLRLAHFAPSRIVELDSKAELPTNSIIHILDDILHPDEHSDVPRVDENEFLKHETFKKFIFHIKTPMIEPITVDDKYIYRPAGLPTAFMNFRMQQKNNFRYVNEISELPTKKESLIVVNHNPLFRIVVYGRMQLFRKLQLILASILNTAIALKDLNKQQFIHLPWGTEIFDKQMFIKSRAVLDTSSIKRPASAHYILMMNLVNFLWDTATTSLFKKIPEEVLPQINIILQCNNKYLFYNLDDLQKMNEKNRIYLKFVNQLNALSLLGRVEEVGDAEKVELIEEKFNKHEASENTPIASTVYEPDCIVDTTTDEDTANKSTHDKDIAIEETLRDLDIEIPVKITDMVDTDDTNIQGVVNTPSPVSVVKSIIKPVPKTTAAIATTVPKLYEKENATAIAADISTTDTYIADFTRDNDQATYEFIEKQEHLTPRQKERYHRLSNKYKDLVLNGRRIGTLLNESTDIGIDKEYLSTEQIGDLPDTSALKSTLRVFDKNYMEKMYHKQLAATFTAFQKDGVFLTNIQEKRINTQLHNYTEYTLKFEDIYGAVSSSKIRIPNVTNEGKIIIDGVTQVQKKQRVILPIVKISPTSVSLASSLNKTLIERNMTKAHSFLSYVDMILNSKRNRADVTYGKCNINLPISYEYTQLASKYRIVSLQDTQFYFNYPTRIEHFGNDAKKLEKLEKMYGTYCGKTNKSWLFVDAENTIRGYCWPNGEDTDLPYSNFIEYFKDGLFPGNKVSKMLTEWVSIKILDAFLPIIFLLGYRYGLRNTLEYIGLKYTITESKSKRIVGESGTASFDKKNIGSNIVGSNWIKVPHDKLNSSIITIGTESLEDFCLSVPKGDYFYNISAKDLGKTALFTPRVPDLIPELEENKTPRICVSESVAGCLIAVPYKNNKYSDRYGSTFGRMHVYGIRKDAIDPKNVITNKKIVDKNYVFDAHITEEAWITAPVTMVKLGIIRYYANSDIITICYKPSRVYDHMIHKWTSYYDRTEMMNICPYEWIEGKDPATDEKIFDPGKNYVNTIQPNNYSKLLTNAYNEIIKTSTKINGSSLEYFRDTIKPYLTEHEVLIPHTEYAKMVKDAGFGSVYNVYTYPVFCFMGDIGKCIVENNVNGLITQLHKKYPNKIVYIEPYENELTSVEDVDIRICHMLVYGRRMRCMPKESYTKYTQGVHRYMPYLYELDAAVYDAFNKYIRTKNLSKVIPQYSDTVINKNQIRGMESFTDSISNKNSSQLDVFPDNIEYLDDLIELNLDPSRFIVIGSAALALYGIKKNSDIDVHLDDDYKEELRRDGKIEEYSDNGITKLRIVGTDIDVGMLDTKLSVPSELISKLDYVKVKGIRVLSLLSLFNLYAWLYDNAPNEEKKQKRITQLKMLHDFLRTKFPVLYHGSRFKMTEIHPRTTPDFRDRGPLVFATCNLPIAFMFATGLRDDDVDIAWSYPTDPADCLNAKLVLTFKKDLKEFKVPELYIYHLENDESFQCLIGKDVENYGHPVAEMVSPKIANIIHTTVIKDWLQELKKYVESGEIELRGKYQLPASVFTDETKSDKLLSGIVSGSALMKAVDNTPDTELDEDEDIDTSPISDAVRYKPKPNDIAIRFADRTIWFNRYPLVKSLIAAGLDNYDLTNYNLNEFESPDVYFRLLSDNNISTNYLKGINTFFDDFIDPVTYQILKMMNEPTNLRDLFIRATELLTTLDARESSSGKNHRVRGYEQFIAIVYSEMANRMAYYKAHRGKANVYSINPDAVYLRILQNTAMVTSEAANPLQDLKEIAYVTYSGITGRTAESFVLKDRKLSADDLGVISEGTVDNQKVGLNAQLSYDPCITNVLGVIRPSETIEPANALSATALVFPFSSHDDLLV